MLYFLISPLVIYPMWSNGLIGGLAWWSLWLAGATFVPAWQAHDNNTLDAEDPYSRSLPANNISSLLSRYF